MNDRQDAASRHDRPAFDADPRFENNGEHAITASDWRAPGTGAGPSLKRRAAPVAAPPKSTDRFHLKARKASAPTERARAVEIIDGAKATVSDTFAEIRAGQQIRVATLAPVVDAIAASISRDASAIPGVTRLKERHEYTYLHSVSVCGLMIGLALALELDPALTQEIGIAGLLHDIGKARVPTLLLDKPGPLTDEEFAVVKTHTERGRDLLVTSGIESRIILDVCLHHHERIDGRGYPSRLSGDAVSLYARMGAVCDVYDAVTSARAYKDGWSPGEALDWMEDAAGHFDRRVFAAFKTVIGTLLPGTLVRLESDRLGLIVDAGNQDVSEPRVVTFFSAMTAQSLPFRLVATESDPIRSIEKPARWRFGDWPALKAEMFRHYAENRVISRR